MPRAMRELLEHHGRAAGCSLAELELAGADLDTAEAFVIAAEQGEAETFARALVARHRAGALGAGPVAA